MKGQVSTELLVIVALVLLVFIPLLVLVYLKAGEATDTVGSYQAELVVIRLASLANSVGSLGTNTSVTTDVFIPPNTEVLETSQSGRGGEITLKVSGPGGDTEIVDVVKYPIVNPGTIADSSAAGGRIRLNISSEVGTGGQASIRIERS